MNYRKYENESKNSGKYFFLFFAILQSLFFLFGLMQGINPTSMVVFASTSLGSTIIVYMLYNKRNSQKNLHSI
jgi:hypothetical protein